MPLGFVARRKLRKECFRLLLAYVIHQFYARIFIAFADIEHPIANTLRRYRYIVIGYRLLLHRH